MYIYKYVKMLKEGEQYIFCYLFIKLYKNMLDDDYMVRKLIKKK